MLNKCFPNTMETVQGYRHTEAWEGLRFQRVTDQYPSCVIRRNYELMILNRIAPTIKQHLIKELVGFRPCKSCTNQLLNLTQHIECGYQESMITGTAFVDLSAAYDAVNHILLIQQLFYITQDRTLCSYSELYVELNNEQQMETTEEWPATRVCSLPNSLQHIHQ